MEYITAVINKFSGWMGPYLPEIAMAITATLLVVFGDKINRDVKKRIQKFNLVVRTGIFILVLLFL